MKHTLPAFGAKNTSEEMAKKKKTDHEWDKKDDEWLRRMWYLRKGFFQTGVIPEYKDN